MKVHAKNDFVGVDKIETDEAKGTVAVTGTADPYDIIVRARKAISCAGKYAEVVSIGPPPKPDDKEKKPDNKDKKPADDKDKKPPPPCPCPCPYPCPPNYCPSYGYAVVVPRETYPPCSIL